MEVKFHIITTIPDFFKTPLETSIIGRAVKNNLVSFYIYDLHNWGLGNYRHIDDTPYGGGPGMVIRADVIANAIREIKSDKDIPVVFFSPDGKNLSQKDIIDFTKKEYKEYIIVCGHFEGVDYRVYKLFDYIFRVGDFVMTGGEIPTLAFVDALCRYIPDVLGNIDSLYEESFGECINNKIEAPCYTRPFEWEDQKVPKILTNGNHKEIEKWKLDNIREKL